MAKSKSGNPNAYFQIDNRMAHWKKGNGVWGFVDILTGKESIVVASGSIVDHIKYTTIKNTTINVMPQWLFDETNLEMIRAYKDIKDRCNRDACERQAMTESIEDMTNLLVKMVMLILY